MNQLWWLIRTGCRFLVIAVRYELRIWRSLGVWLLRRPTVPPGTRGYAYAGAVTPMLLVFIALSAVELPVLHLLLPWEAVRLLVDLLGIWGLLWMIGLLAALRVHPHLVTDDGIRVRYGSSVTVTVPWSAVAAVRSRGRMLEKSRTVQYGQTPAGLVASVAVAKQTTIDLVLREPTVLSGIADKPVIELRLHADDPKALVADIRNLLGESGTSGVGPAGEAGPGLDRARP